MYTKHTASALALAVAALTLAACGGGDDDTAPPVPCSGAGCGAGGGSGTVAAAILPAVIDFDAREELLRPGATVPLQVELEDARDHDVSDPAATNVQLAILADATGGAQLSASQLSTRRGQANFSITLGVGLGTVIVKATTDRIDNNIANGIADELSWLLGMVVTQQGDGLNWELPAVVEMGAGGTARLEDADDGRKPRSYTVTGAGGFTLASCGDDVCLKVPAGAAAGSYAVTFTVSDAAGSQLAMPVSVVVR